MFNNILCVVMVEYSEDIQKLLIETMLSNEECFSRSRRIIQEKYFDEKFRKTIYVINDYVNQYNELPKPDLIKAKTNIEYSIRDNITSKDVDWYLENIEGFCRHRAIHNALIIGADKWQSGDYGTAESELKKALSVSLFKDIGISYFENPKLRLEKLKESNGQISTGYKSIDDKLYGGINVGELMIFCGTSGSGKSLVLQNLALNWSLAGKNVVIVSLELSPELISLRLDAMLSSTSTKQIFKNIDFIDSKIREFSGGGRIQIKYMNPGTTCRDISSYLSEYEIQTKLTPDVLIMDYVDLAHPNSKKITLNDVYTKDKIVCEELRSLANDKKMILVTASQLNRTAVSETEHDHSHIGGGLSKIQTADNVLSILATPTMMERGKYRLMFLKTRSSSGVGSKVDLSYNSQSMRISDEIESSNTSKSTNELSDELKRKSKTYKTESNNNTDNLLDKVKKGQTLREKMYS